MTGLSTVNSMYELTGKETARGSFLCVIVEVGAALIVDLLPDANRVDIFCQEQMKTLRPKTEGKRRDDAGSCVVTPDPVCMCFTAQVNCGSPMLDCK